MTEKLSHEEFERNYSNVKQRIKSALIQNGREEDSVTLLAAIKTVDAETVNYAVKSGIDYVGENKVQEFLSKDGLITEKCHRHFIGHLQTNKVKDIVGRVEMIESVDSLKLASEISKQSKKIGVVTDILLEVNIGGEEAKWGFAPDETEEAINKISVLPNIRIKGLMTVPPICEDREVLREYFRKMHKLFIDIQSKTKDNVSMDILSMGMSEDFDLAITEGATLVRVGTALFGKRIYQ